LSINDVTRRTVGLLLGSVAIALPISTTWL
jgi:hypothetical protein